VAKFELGVRPKFLTREGRESDNIGLTARKDFLTGEGRGSGKIWVEREGFARERERERERVTTESKCRRTCYTRGFFCTNPLS